MPLASAIMVYINTSKQKLASRGLSNLIRSSHLLLPTLLPSTSIWGNLRQPRALIFRCSRSTQKMSRYFANLAACNSKLERKI